MQGFIIVWCGYEGLEKVVGLFTEEEAVERMKRFRKAEFKTTYYVPLPEDWDILTKTNEDYEKEDHTKLYDKWTTEDHFQDKLDDQIRYARDDKITREDFPDMSDEDFEYQVHLRSKEYRLQKFTDRFCVMEIDTSGAECVCVKLGVPASEGWLY
jgi:hypothetical protein